MGQELPNLADLEEENPDDFRYCEKMGLRC